MKMMLPGGKQTPNRGFFVHWHENQQGLVAKVPLAVQIFMPDLARRAGPIFEKSVP